MLVCAAVAIAPCNYRPLLLTTGRRHHARVCRRATAPYNYRPLLLTTGRRHHARVCRRRHRPIQLPPLTTYYWA
eukprot:scaffold946_cov39-Phaeocystis_antarctica.AAC.1